MAYFNHPLLTSGVVAALIIVSASILYSKYKKWKTPVHGIPLVPGAHWLLGSVNFFLSSHDGTIKSLKTLGEVFCIFVPLGPVGVVGTTTEFIDAFKDRMLVTMSRTTQLTFSQFFKNGLIALEGEQWKKHVRVLGPMMSVSSLKQAVSSMVRAVDGLTLKWKTEVDPDKPLNVEGDIKNLALSIICDFLIGRDLSSAGGSCAHELTQHCEVLLTAVDKEVYENPLYKMIFGDRPPVRRARKYLWGLMQEVMSECREHPEKAERHAVGRIMAAVKAEAVTFTDQELLDEIVMMLFGGSDTTAVSLMWAFKALSAAPHVQSKLRSEIKEVLGPSPPTYDDVTQHMPYLDICFKEIMRVARTAPGCGRTLLTDYQLKGDTKAIVPKGATMMLGISGIHMNPRYWVDPELFWPERWEEGVGKGQGAMGLPITPAAWAPFGAGHRGCFGQRMATVEMKVLLVQLLRSFEFSPSGDPELDNWDMVERITTRPKNPYFKLRPLG
ncbi:hypothetical protein CEUSTIGMA_g8722.t1 [Chlamydomonas eustigma]|uniref:Cytochrome P450 n=1 Tax=Chlamydomonas eustigma TaxID=1157962 RepID=A0A250XES7_9CHLO|nr:hypothetical protein CEUSTIGMA_g8722.t1 [Chlamydomonas eustigma]|eukprot:GAX81290.1 hypothetical protein CEUSTIGMA_g8722.t1 [Chlamydomonas eustigma]